LEIQKAFVTLQNSSADIEWFVINHQPNCLAIGDVDHDLVAFGIPIADLGVREGPPFVHAIQVRSIKAVRITFIEISSPTNMTIGKREQRLALRQYFEVQFILAQAPRFD
jgi:hypothetical protein